MQLTSRIMTRTVSNQFKKAADEEFDHLAWCEQRLDELGERPSRLAPVWYAGAYAIGAASGGLGDRWRLGFIAETENQVCEHLSRHLQDLPANDEKVEVVRTMRDEEEQHGQAATNAGAATLPAPDIHYVCS